MTTPAHAVDGNVSSKYQSYGGGGTTAKAYMNFTSSKRVEWKSIAVNDYCPGDGGYGYAKLMVRYAGTSSWTTVGTRSDRRGCDSAQYTDSLAYWGSDRRINDATIVACVQGKGCASPNSSYRDNPYWG